MDIINPFKEYHSKNHRVFSCQYHVIFCPKYRREILINGVDETAKQIFLETAEMYGFHIIEMEVMPDHVHLLIDCDPDFGITQCVRKLKSRSSHIIAREYPEIRRKLPSIWTRSSFISSVGAVSLKTVKEYIADQKKV